MGEGLPMAAQEAAITSDECTDNWQCAAAPGVRVPVTCVEKQETCLCLSRGSSAAGGGRRSREAFSRSGASAP